MILLTFFLQDKPSSIFTIFLPWQAYSSLADEPIPRVYTCVDAWGVSWGPDSMPGIVG